MAEPMGFVTSPPPPDDESAAFAESIERARADAKAGRTIPYEEIRRWLLSWGTKDELPPPKRP